MARVQLLLCFAFLFASVTFMEVVTAHLNLKPSLPQIEAPKTVMEIEPYTVKVVMVFVSDLEKECPKTNKFKAFFERLRAYAKYVCPIGRKGEKDYDRDMKAKAGSLLQAISSFAVGKIKEKIREEIREEKEEAIQTFKFMKSVAAKILGGRKKEESEESMKLTAEQQKEIQDGILKWETVIAKITNTMVETTTTTTTTTSGGESTSGKESQTGGNSKSSGSGSSSSGSGVTFKDTTGSGSNSGSPSGSPANSPSASTYAAAGGSGSSANSPSASTYAAAGGSGSSANSPSASTYAAAGGSGSPANSPSASTYAAAGGSGSGSGSGTSFKDTTGGSPAAGPTSSGSSESASSSQSSATTVAEVEAETSKEVMTFIMNLEKKCPPKEEYKSFFEKLKGTMIASVKVTAEKKKGFFAGVKSAAGKVSDAMSFMGSRIGSKSSEVKKSMENYHAEVTKALQELDAIHSKIISQNQGKKDGSVSVTAEQRTEIKQTITKWETVTTQFVETCMNSEASSNSTVGIDKVKLT